jgi:hypothetical protein
LKANFETSFFLQHRLQR